MDKLLTRCEAYSLLGITKDISYNDDYENKKDLIKHEDSLWEQSNDEEQGAARADDKDDVEVFVERGSGSSNRWTIRKKSIKMMIRF